MQYAATYGADAPASRGRSEIAGWFGGRLLTADSPPAPIGGRVGCGQRHVRLDGRASAWRVRLGTASVDRSGTFRGSTVTLANPGLDIASASGNWGGRFLNRPDAPGDPRLITGTLGRQPTTSGGTDVVFVGGITAPSGRNQPGARGRDRGARFRRARERRRSAASPGSRPERARTGPRASCP